MTTHKASSIDWEAQLRSWVKPPSDHEDSKRDKTEDQIRAALVASNRLRGHQYKVYAKGSYANNTNVRLDYDVDIAVECTEFYYNDTSGAPADVVKAAETTTTPYTKKYGPTEFKYDVEHALVDYYGRSAVTRGNMAMRVREGKTTLPADVVPCFEYHLVYGTDWRGELKFHQGTRIYRDSDGYTHNWPRQQSEMGNFKNNATGHRYKRMVRALKRLENELVNAGQITDLPSFLMECLVYNVPDYAFNHTTYVTDMREVLAAIFNATLNAADCNNWLEVSERKCLFRPSQPWTRQQAHLLASKAWDWMGLA